MNIGLKILGNILVDERQADSEKEQKKTSGLSP
jgi:hypothetical protein